MVKRLVGYPVALCGSVLLFPGLMLKAFGRVPVQRQAHFLIPLFKLAGAIMVLIGRKLFIEGKKLSAIPAEYLLTKDKRPPVLYLRSFELEPLTNREARTLRQNPGDISFDLDVHTQEEVLSKTLKRVGPCVAVGDPRSDKVVLGFSRLKLGDDWKERVQDLIEQSTLVVHCAGGTPGLLWELEQVARIVKPRSKLLLVVTPTITTEWWELADRLFGRVPRFTVSSEDDQPYIAVIYFDEADKPHSELIYGEGKPPRVVLEEALDPLLYQLKIRPRHKLLRWFSYPIHWLLLLVISWVLFLLYLPTIALLME